MTGRAGLDRGAVELDPNYKKTLTLKMYGRELRLRVARDLFSGFDVDAGSRLLLRTLAEGAHEGLLRVVDLGCGYGPIGLALKLLNPERTVHMVDKDALALEYTRSNAALNGFEGVEVYGSLGWQSVHGSDFDLGVSNVPAKVGDKGIEHFLLGGRGYVRKPGLMAIVVIEPIDALVLRILASDPDVEIVSRRETPAYSVYLYRFLHARPVSPSTNGTEADRVFERRTFNVGYRGLRYELRTAYTLAEFDSLGYQTELIADSLLAIKRAPRHVTVFNPGQGHIPVIAWKLFEPDLIRIVGRDLLALSYSRVNLSNNGAPENRIALGHQVEIAEPDVAQSDLVVGVLRDGLPVEASAMGLQQHARVLRKGAWVVLGGTSTMVTRLQSSLSMDKRLVITSRRRNRGHSVLVLRKT